MRPAHHRPCCERNPAGHTSAHYATALSAVQCHGRADEYCRPRTASTDGCCPSRPSDEGTLMCS
eukprot:6201125-Pleurochrysis_carterae.AAC.2